MSHKVLFIDPIGGLSGDMFLGAFLDMGLPPEFLRTGLEKVGLRRFFELRVTTVTRHQIAARKIEFPGREEALTDPAPRTLAAVKDFLAAAKLPPAIQNFSLQVFTHLARAEARVHGVSIEKVHFHEVGDYDTLADIVGTALALEWLQPEYLSLKAIPLGSGEVDCAHGRLPVPVPAVMALLEDLPVYAGGIEAELVTPTGAAIIKTLVEMLAPVAGMVCKLGRSGYGAGRRDHSQKPNLLRLASGMVAAPAAPAAALKNDSFSLETLITLEAAIDDMTPEKIACLKERLRADGALEVADRPLFMKKGRLGNNLLVLLKPEAEEKIIERIFTESTTLGIRRSVGERYFLEREISVQPTSFGEIRCKIAYDKSGRPLNLKLEHDDLVRLAEKHSLPITRLEQLILAELVIPANDQTHWFLRSVAE